MIRVEKFCEDIKWKILLFRKALKFSLLDRANIF